MAELLADGGKIPVNNDDPELANHGFADCAGHIKGRSKPQAPKLNEFLIERRLRRFKNPQTKEQREELSTFFEGYYPKYNKNKQ